MAVRKNLKIVSHNATRIDHDPYAGIRHLRSAVSSNKVQSMLTKDIQVSKGLASDILRLGFIIVQCENLSACVNLNSTYFVLISALRLARRYHDLPATRLAKMAPKLEVSDAA